MPRRHAFVRRLRTIHGPSLVALLRLVAGRVVTFANAARRSRSCYTRAHPRTAFAAIATVTAAVVLASQLQATTALRASLLDSRDRVAALELASRTSDGRRAVRVAALVPADTEPSPSDAANVAEMLARRTARLRTRLNVRTTDTHPAPSAVSGIVGTSAVASLADLLGKGKDGQILTVIGGTVRWADAPYLTPGGYGPAGQGTGGRNPDSGGGGASRGGGGSVTIINSTQVHNHQDDAGGGILDLLRATTGTLTAARGGTNFVSYSTGDLLVGAANGALEKLSRGAAGFVATSSGDTVRWLSPGFVAAAGGWIDDGRPLRIAEGLLPFFGRLDYRSLRHQTSGAAC